MQRMKNIFKRDRSRSPPKYLKRNMAVKKKIKAERREYLKDPRVKAKYTSKITGDQRKQNNWRWKKETRDNFQDANVKSNYARGYEPIEMSRHRAREEEATQFSQTEDADFEHQLGGGRYNEERDRATYYKDTEINNYYKRDEGRYRNRWDEPLEDRMGSRGYNEIKDRATYEIGTGMDEYEMDERRYKDRSESPLYLSESDCSDSECSSRDYRSHSRSPVEPWHSADYGYKKRLRWDEFEDVSARLLPADHSVYRAHESRARRQPIETEYRSDSVTDTETYGGKSYYNTEIASEVTDYNTDYSLEKFKGRHMEQREDRDERYGHKSKRKQRSGGFGQRPFVCVAQTENLQTAFEQQRGSPAKEYPGADHSKMHRFPEKDSEGSKTVFVPVIVNGDGLGRPERREMSPEQLIKKAKEKAEKPFEDNVKVYATTKIDQANIFAGRATESYNTKTDGNILLLEQPISGQTIKEVENSSQKMSPISLGAQQKTEGNDPSTARGNQIRKPFKSIWPVPEYINAHASQEEGNMTQNVLPSDLFSTHQRIDESPSYPIRKSVIHIPPILKTRSAASEVRSVHKNSEPSYKQEEKESLEYVRTNETRVRESEHNKQSSATKARKSIAENTRNSTEMKSILQRTLSSENHTKNHSLLRQISGTRRSNMILEGTDQDVGSINKKIPPHHSPISTKMSDGKGQESIGNIYRNLTKVTKLFHRKKKKHIEDESAGESEELNRSRMFSNTSNSPQTDQSPQDLNLWGYDASFIIKLFSAMRGFLGLTIHDTMINVLKNIDN